MKLSDWEKRELGAIDMEGEVGLADSVEMTDGGLSLAEMRKLFLFKLQSNLSVGDGDC